MADNKRTTPATLQEKTEDLAMRIVPAAVGLGERAEVSLEPQAGPLMAVAMAVGRVGMGEMTMANVRNTISLVLPASKDEGQKFVNDLTKMLQVMEAARNFATEEFWARNK